MYFTNFAKEIVLYYKTVNPISLSKAESTLLLKINFHHLRITLNFLPQ